MARNINSLLNKKGWTGTEVGKALVASIVHDIRHRNEPDYKPLFSQSDFDKMESNLKTERDFLAYGVYRDIYSGLIDAFNRGQGLYQQFGNGYYRFAMYLKDAQNAEYMLSRAELIPYVMTQEQYTALKEIAETRLKGFSESFSSLLFTMLSVLMESPETAPDAIREAIEASKEEAVTNERILSSYNRHYGLGYYTLPDGTRSDQLQSGEWQAKLKADYLKKHKLLINGKQASFEDTALHYNGERHLKACEIFFNGIEALRERYREYTGEELPEGEGAELMEALENTISYGTKNLRNPIENRTVPYHPAYSHIQLILDGELADGAEWHYYEQPPQDLNKYDILKDEEFYNGADAEDGEPQLAEFKADYPKLYKALEAYIKELVPQAKTLKPSQYSKEFISWGELAELGIEKYITLTTADEGDITELIANEGEETTENSMLRRRIALNGITIAQDPRPYQLNESNEYIDNLQDILLFGRENNIDSIAENDILREDIIAFQENLFKPALRYIYSFNALVKIIASVYDIDDMGEVELDTTRFEKQLDALNSTIHLFYTGVYGTKAERQRKRELIKEIFFPVDYTELQPTEEALQAVTAELDALGFSSEARKKLKKFDSLIERLGERGL